MILTLMSFHVALTFSYLDNGQAHFDTITLVLIVIASPKFCVTTFPVPSLVAMTHGYL